MSVKCLKISISVHGLDIRDEAATKFLAEWVEECVTACLNGRNRELFNLREDGDITVEIKDASCRNLASELKEAFSQLTRYGTLVETEDLMNLLWEIVNINDDIAHDRSTDSIRMHVEKAKEILDKISST